MGNTDTDAHLADGFITADFPQACILECRADFLRQGDGALQRCVG
jgi:hypothetical protein